MNRINPTNKDFSLRMEAAFIYPFLENRYSERMFEIINHDTSLLGWWAQEHLHLDAIARRGHEVETFEFKFREYRQGFEQGIGLKESLLNHCKADILLLGALADKNETEMNIYLYNWPELQPWIIQNMHKIEMNQGVRWLLPSMIEAETNCLMEKVHAKRIKAPDQTTKSISFDRMIFSRVNA